MISEDEALTLGQTATPDSDEEQETELVPVEESVDEAETSMELALFDDPVDRLSASQINAVMRIIQFPNAPMQSVADAVGVSRQTIYNWKKNKDFQAFMTLSQKSMVEKTINVRVNRNAHVFDKFSEELFTRLEQPETDEDKLRDILGENYTQSQLASYRSRFATSLPVKDLVQIYMQLQTEVRKDELQHGSGENEESLFERIQVVYERRQIRKRKRQDFTRDSGFTYDVDFNEVNATEVYAGNAQKPTDGDGEKEEYIEAEFVEAGEETPDLLSMFTVETT